MVMPPLLSQMPLSLSPGLHLINYKSHFVSGAAALNSPVGENEPKTTAQSRILNLTSENAQETPPGW